MKRILLGLALSSVVAMAGCRPAGTSVPATPQTPYQKAATVMLDFSADLRTAQTTEISLFKGGAIDAPTHHTIEQAFYQISGYGLQVDSLLAAQASSTTILAKVNAAIASLGSIALSTGAIDAATSAQIKAAIQAVTSLLTQVQTIFSGVSRLNPTPHGGDVWTLQLSQPLPSNC